MDLTWVMDLESMMDLASVVDLVSVMESVVDIGGPPPMSPTDRAMWCQASPARPGTAVGSTGVPAYEAVNPALDVSPLPW